MYLSNLPVNETAKIKKINTSKIIKERLHSLGLMKGAEIKHVRNSPLGCPGIYYCLNTNVAIRNRIAKQIEIIYEK